MTLTEIANKHTCDKGTEWYEKHSYTIEYEKYIPSFGSYTLLEIGVWHGDSLRMWNEYNPEMKIWGMDNDRNVYNFINPSENINIYIGSQNNQDDLNRIIELNNDRFDYIIDDGSHYTSDILISFEHLFPFLSEGGIYFIEDLHFSGVGGILQGVQEWLEKNNIKAKVDVLCNNKLLMIRK